MNILRFLIQLFLGLFQTNGENKKTSSPFSVKTHKRSQACGKGWGDRREIKVGEYWKNRN